MIDHLDHLVLTTAHETACIDFYTASKNTYKSTHDDSKWYIKKWI